MAISVARTPLYLWTIIALSAGCSSGTQQRPSRPEPLDPQKVTADDLEHAGADPVEKMLQAKNPGVLVTRTDAGGISVQIRGQSSFYSGNEPLYLIDDVPFNPGPNGLLTGINPHDIESIQVLKNPEDVGMYGVRGSNGVIKIQMKKPGKRT